MAKVEGSVWIAAPPDAVFSRLADLTHGPEWVPGLLKADRTSTIEAGPGLEVAFAVKVGAQESSGRGLLQDWEPPGRLVLEASFDAGVAATADLRLQAATDGTEIKAGVDYTITAKGVGRLAGGLLGGPIARRHLRRALDFLKEELEKETRLS